MTQGDLEAVNQLLGAMEERGARAQLKVAQDEASGVQIFHRDVIVNLDADQLKHQPVGYRIGTRAAHAGTKWSAELQPNAAWHQANTLPIIGDWAADLRMQDGDSIPTKQGVPLVDGNRYEGFCVQVDGQKYVFFHCYPGK